MEVTKRLKKIVDYVGLTPNAFAVKIGISQPRMRNYLTGRDPDFETLNQICITFDIINPRWLLTGEGDMLATSNEPIATELPKSTCELTAIIKTQAETILKQQQFINDHFMELHQKKMPPPCGGEEYPDKKCIKE